MIAAMPGRPRNADRQAIEAFARIHQGKAGSANGAGLFTGRPRIHPYPTVDLRDDHPSNGSGALSTGPSIPPTVHDFNLGGAALIADPTDPASYGYLPALPNLERPRIGRRVAIASTATVVVILIALGIAGAASGPRRGHHSSTGPSSSKTATTAGHAASTPSPGAHGRSGQARSATITPVTGPISPTSTTSGSVEFLMAQGSGPFSVTISADGGPCWAEVSSSSGGIVSWAGTVADGSQHVLAPGASWWLRLGAPEYVTVTVNGRPLKLPGTGQPLNVDIATATA